MSTPAKAVFEAGRIILPDGTVISGIENLAPAKPACASCSLPFELEPLDPFGLGVLSVAPAGGGTSGSTGVPPLLLVALAFFLFG